MSFGLTLSAAAGSAALFYAGFLAKRLPTGWTYRTRGGFVVMVLLTLFAGYFDWKDYNALKEIAAIIEPVPEITGITRVPSPAELQAVSAALAAVPGRGRFGTTQEQRRELDRETRELRARYWIVETKLSGEEVFEFYRAPEHRSGWTLVSDQPPYLELERGSARLTLFVSESWTTGKVLYIYDR